MNDKTQDCATETNHSEQQRRLIKLNEIVERIKEQKRLLAQLQNRSSANNVYGGGTDHVYLAGLFMPAYTSGFNGAEVNHSHFPVGGYNIIYVMMIALAKQKLSELEAELDTYSIIKDAQPC